MSPHTAPLLAAGLGVVTLVVYGGVRGHQWRPCCSSRWTRLILALHYTSHSTLNIDSRANKKTRCERRAHPPPPPFFRLTSSFLGDKLLLAFLIRPVSSVPASAVETIEAGGWGEAEDGAAGAILSQRAPSRAANQAAAASARLCSFEITSSPLLQGLHIDHNNPPKWSYCPPTTPHTPPPPTPQHSTCGKFILVS